MVDRAEPVWIDTALALAIHDRQLAEHGGPVGLRDAAALDSALAWPRNHGAYGETDLSAHTAAYAFGLARNHPFVDSNKRTAWILARLFLALNDMTLVFKAEDAIHTMIALAAGDLEERTLAAWFKARCIA